MWQVGGPSEHRNYQLALGIAVGSIGFLELIEHAVDVGLARTRKTHLRDLSLEVREHRLEELYNLTATHIVPVLCAGRYQRDNERRVGNKKGVPLSGHEAQGLEIGARGPGSRAESEWAVTGGETKTP